MATWLDSLTDGKEYTRFDERDTVFARVRFDTEAPFYGKSIHAAVPGILAQGREGYSRIEYERSRAAWAVQDRLQSGYGVTWSRTEKREWEETFERHAVEDAIAMSAAVKEAGLLYGASLVGITTLGLRWVYSHRRNGDPIEIPTGCRNVIVMATAMDAGLIRRSPSYAATAAVGVGYSRMAFLSCLMAEFIRNLGYRAIPMGNDSALSIPLAIAAGLGKLGRNGLLLTESYGACVRLCKVVTDLPLEPDEPPAQAVQEQCRSCRICAESCPAGAIVHDREPCFEVPGRSNSRGLRRWAVDPERCYGFWVENGDDCSSCIGSCPLTPR